MGKVFLLTPQTVFKPITRPLSDFFAFVGELALITWDTFRRFLRPPFEKQETIGQMAFIGAASVPIVVLTNFFSGAVLALYTAQFLTRYGAGEFVGGTVGLSVAREIGPVLAGIMVAARCGSAMAAQIGTMAVTEQIDALKMLSVNPINYLVVPRVAASALMLPILALIGIYAGGLGGLLIAADNGVSNSTFMASIQHYVNASDILGGVCKAPVFGLIIAIVACQQGLRTRNGAVGVGRSTTNTVVISMILIYIANFFLAQLFFG